MSVFDELLAIKRFREGQAELAVVRQRQMHADAQRERDAAADRLVRFQQWAQRHERALYQDLCSRVVRVHEIEDVMQGVAGLREGERDHAAKVETADEQVKREAEALAERRLKHREATRLTEKFVELASLHLAEHMRESERKEDLEMEEAASVARDREEWEQHEEVEPL